VVEVLPATEWIKHKARSPAVWLGFLLLVEINFNVYISDADALKTPSILENVLYNYWGGLYGCACRFKRCTLLVVKRVFLHHTRLFKLNIGLFSQFSRRIRMYKLRKGIFIVRLYVN
jgi:hypothetical protein